MAKSRYEGPPILGAAFRPFFLMALVLAIVIVPLWLAVYLGNMKPLGSFMPVDWHVHEMMFGYTAAALTGFLFTAIPNWTGRLPIQGWSLAVLALIWIAGRIAMIGGFGGNAIAVAMIDCAFLATVSLATFREIIAGKNWRNLMVAIPVLVFLLANILYHGEVIQYGSADYARRMSIAVPGFLVMFIGGRIIPSFTRNWLSKRGPGPMPVPFGRFDVACLLLGGGALMAWVIVPDAPLTGIALVLAAVAHLARLARWQGGRTLSSMLLLALHISYAFIALGLLAIGLGAEISGFHLLGISGIGGMTLAVMIRATLGHTGHPLEMGSALALAFFLVIAAGLVRSLASHADGDHALIIVAALWSTGFAIATFRLAALCSGAPEN